MLNNLYAFLRARLSNVGSNIGSVTYKNTSGGIRGRVLKTANISSTKNTTDGLTDVYVLQLGSGRTPASIYDYKLESPISDDLLSEQYSTGSFYTGDPNSKLIMLFTHKIKNASSEPIMVSEMGVLISDCLVTRTVLDNPVTLQPGEHHTFIETVEMP